MLIKEFVKDYNWVIEDQDTEDNNYIDCYNVDIIPFENRGYEYPEIISFKATFFENEMRIFYISVDKGWARMNGFIKLTVFCKHFLQKVANHFCRKLQSKNVGCCRLHFVGYCNAVTG